MTWPLPPDRARTSRSWREGAGQAVTELPVDYDASTVGRAARAAYAEVPYSEEGLVAGTLADLRTIMAHPIGMRRGHTELLPAPVVAAGAQFTRVIDSAWWERLVSLTFTFTASAAAGLRQLLLNILSADGAIINQTQLAPAVVAGETWLVSGDLEQGGVPGSSPSSSNEGSVTSPAAGATIVSLALGAGEWVLNWTVGVTGTVGAPEVNNFQLNQGATQLAVSVNENSVTVNYPQPAVQVSIPAGGATITIKAIALGTVGAVYAAVITATPLQQNASYPQLPDIVAKSAWQYQIAVTGIQAADQLSSIVQLTERYASNYADGALGHDIADLVVRSLYPPG